MRTLRRLLLFATGALVASSLTIQAKSSPSPPETFVIVHGAWGGGWAFKEVAGLLHTKGHTVYRPTLTGLGERAHLAHPGIDLSLHIQDVVNTIVWEQLTDVVLVGHSYGGMVIAGVADRIPERIKRIVYLDAIVPFDGESADDAFGSADKSKDGFIVPAWVKEGTPVPHDVPQPEKTQSEPIHISQQAAVTRLPTRYILTVDDSKAPETDTFFKFYERAKARGWSIEIMPGDHNVQWSQPAELAKRLQ